MLILRHKRVTYVHQNYDELVTNNTVICVPLRFAELLWSSP